jgi:hypothetical protein
MSLPLAASLKLASQELPTSQSYVVDEMQLGVEWSFGDRD